MYPPVLFNGVQARAIASGFAKTILRTGCVIHACAILPDHVHLVLRRHRYSMQEVVNLLKGNATAMLREEGIHPLAPYADKNKPLPSPWSHGHWMVYIDNESYLRAAVKYVNDNPMKEGKRKQNWKLVTPLE
ncbi:MAG TPA: transposase [Humisphaera sp.]|nr:transposase [Humisphaera sp.]